MLVSTRAVTQWRYATEQFYGVQSILSINIKLFVPDLAAPPLAYIPLKRFVWSQEVNTAFYDKRGF